MKNQPSYQKYSETSIEVVSYLLSINLAALFQMPVSWSTKNSGFNGIQTHDLCDTGAVLYQLSYQANLELVIFWVVL